MEKTQNNDELVSALADGQLRGEAFAQAVALVESSAQARASWQTYHLVGDVLRAGAQAPGVADADFMQRLRTRLQAEANELQPVATELIAAHVVSMRAGGQIDHESGAANASSFRWKLAAGFASLAAVAAITWNAVGGLGDKPAGAELAQSEPATRVAEVPPPATQVMIRDPRLDELLAAHRQAGGNTALQMPAGFLRNATFEAPVR